MGKRKVFHQTNLSIPQVEQHRGTMSHIVSLPEMLPPTKTTVEFGLNATAYRKFDFAPWYGADIDQITHGCQRQVERFLDRQDGEVEASTVASFCRVGLRHFLDYMVLSAASLRRKLSLKDIDRTLIDGYLSHIARLNYSSQSQKNAYNTTKSVLQALGQRGLIALVDAGDLATFPRNPFPNSNRTPSGETPLSTYERQAFTRAIKQAVMPIWNDDVKVTSALLSYVILIVALHTGRNTTPLLEMERDCLRTHPKKTSSFYSFGNGAGTTPARSPYVLKVSLNAYRNPHLSSKPTWSV